MEKTNNIQKYLEELDSHGVMAFVPNGNSMWPFLKNHGQSVVIEKKCGRLQKYDVAFYVRDNGQIVLHRIIEVTDDGYIFCGDSQFVCEKVLENNVFGIMSGYYEGEKLINVNTKEYREKAEKWYKKKTIRWIKIKLFFFNKKWLGRIKRVLKKAFHLGNKNV